MSWAVGYDENWRRDIGYGVPATCDHPGCGAEINRGLGCVCGGEPYGGERGCGLYFCGKHLFCYAKLPMLCSRCAPKRRKPFEPTPDTTEWINHKLNDESWAVWRDTNSSDVGLLRAELERRAHTSTCSETETKA